jgi:excisionase family DNA binding protein
MSQELKCLTEAQAAEMLCVSRRTLLRLRASGKLPAVLIGSCIRYRHVDLENFLNRQRAGGADAA